MKKRAVLVLALAAAAAMGTTVLAAEVDEASKNVTATYVQGDSADTVYSVDVTWGSMEFTYTSPAEGTWNPDTHGYDGAESTGRWTYDEGANVIAVTNHSNTGVEVQLTYTAAEGYDNITGSFDQPTMSLISAVGTAVEEAPSDTAALTIAGELSKSEESVTVGTVTVSLNK